MIDDDDSFPNLPPKLHESERMYHVQKWINSLTWDGESISYAPSAPDSSATDCSHGLITNTKNTHNTHKDNCKNNINYFMNSFHHNTKYHNQTSDAYPHDNNYQDSSRRLFTNEENRILVKIFRDHFASQVCPNLPEVRSRIKGTKLEADRGPISVRNKFKRLQNENQWLNYI